MSSECDIATLQLLLPHAEVAAPSVPRRMERRNGSRSVVGFFLNITKITIENQNQ